MTRGVLFWCSAGMTLLTVLFLTLPVGISILSAFAVAWHKGIGAGLTLQWMGHVLAAYWPTILMSLRVAAACLAVTLVVGVPAAYALATRQGLLSRLFEETLTLPIAVPGIAIAIALIQTHQSIRTSWVFILIGHVIFTLPFMVRAVTAIMRRMQLRALEEGAATLGAGFWRRFFTVVLPNALPGILAGSLMVVTLSLGEFNLTMFLHTPLTMTLPVGLYDAYASLRMEVGAAYTVIFFVLIIPLLLAMQRLGGDRRVGGGV